jgi:hypothetical protein
MRDAYNAMKFRSISISLCKKTRKDHLPLLHLPDNEAESNSSENFQSRLLWAEIYKRIPLMVSEKKHADKKRTATFDIPFLYLVQRIHNKHKLGGAEN